MEDKYSDPIWGYYLFVFLVSSVTFVVARVVYQRSQEGFSKIPLGMKIFLGGQSLLYAIIWPFELASNKLWHGIIGVAVLLFVREYLSQALKTILPVKENPLFWCLFFSVAAVHFAVTFIKGLKKEVERRTIREKM